MLLSLLYILGFLIIKPSTVFALVLEHFCRLKWVLSLLTNGTFEYSILEEQLRFTQTHTPPFPSPQIGSNLEPLPQILAYLSMMTAASQGVYILCPDPKSSLPVLEHLIDLNMLILPQ